MHAARTRAAPTRCAHANAQVVNADVPTLSYLTILDVYLIGCIVFLFCCTWCDCAASPTRTPDPRGLSLDPPAT